MSVNAINTSFYSETKLSTLPGFKSFPYSHFFRLSGFCIYSRAIPPDSSQLVGEKLFHIALLNFGRSACCEMRQHAGYRCKCEVLWLCSVTTQGAVPAYLRQQHRCQRQHHGLQCPGSTIYCLFCITALNLFSLQSEKDIAA